MIERLIHILRNAGFEDLTAEEIADMILLADFLPAAPLPTVDPQIPDPSEPGPKDPATRDPETISPKPPESPPDTKPIRNETTGTNLYDSTANRARDGEGVDVVPYRTPAANALPGAQKITRALRPLRKRYPSARRFVLDEERTVRRIADCGLFSPVLRPAPENWLDAALVFDESVSMRVWRETLDQLERLFERCGYFRDVRSWRINTEHQEAKLYREAAGKFRAERRPGELLDPARRRLIVIVSDCLGPAWRSGAAFRLAHGWAACGPVALVQALPRCFWPGTTMTPVDANLRAPKPGVPNRLLQVSPSWYGEIAEAGGVALPILTLDEWSIAPWAKSVAGAGGIVVSGLMIPPPELMEAATTDAEPAKPEARPASKRVADFFQSASNEARRLACYLASAPLSLPVMRLVQQTMLPESRQAHLAEVFLSGLLYQSTTHANQDEILYEFYDGVRNELRRRVTETETERVIYQVSQYIESRVGGSDSFEALITVPAGEGAVRRLDPVSIRFASLSADILRRSGRHVEIVQRLEKAVGIEASTGAQTITSPGVYIEELSSDTYSELERCLLDWLEEETAAQLASRIAGMTAIEAVSEMRAAGVGLRGGVLFSIRDPLVEFQPESESGRAVHQFLLEALSRTRVLKSKAELEAMIPVAYLGAAVRQEAERFKGELQTAQNAASSNRLMRSTSGQRTAVILTAVELYDRYPGGVLVVDLSKPAIYRYGVMKECIAPFLKLSEKHYDNPVLLPGLFQLHFGRLECLIILDHAGDYREMSSLDLMGGSTIVVIDRLIDPLPSRPAVEARLRETRENYERVAEQLRAIQRERNLINMPAPQLRTNLEIQRRSFLQTIRECESQLRGLGRDPVMGLADLIRRVVVAPGPALGNHPAEIEPLIEALRNADSEATEAKLLRDIGDRFANLESHAIAAEFYEYSLDREPRDLELHLIAFERLADIQRSMSNDQSAALWLERALENAETLKDGPAQIRIADSLSEVRRRMSGRTLDPVPPLQTFTFQTVTLNRQGRELTRRSLSARQFVEELGEGVRLEMVEIPSGSFLMGLAENLVDQEIREYLRYAKEGEENIERWAHRQTPQHEVAVPSFLIGKFAVTQRQWAVVAGWEPIRRRLFQTPSNFDRIDQGPDQPVENICWEDAQEFCVRLSRQTGRGYRLPSEAEWEYACRAGTTTAFAIGETITPQIVCYNGEFPYADAPAGLNRESPIPVGSLGVANGFGLFDMHGNVWEWCEDEWRDGYNGAPEDGRPVIERGDTDRRVLRGGSFKARAFRCSSSFRLSDESRTKAINYGLRVVLSEKPGSAA